ncbi:lectin-like domain-containing protein [Epilithonimonas lactis]|uniref:Gliding motility-associated-like protein n=1 Tax=Epilithonimonas lactis TaxID=421072 RepID=A0A085B6B8_9FLAO|nr:hypothetical protein [Epilithonimonas lactis]KFC18013.1 hypothetical protein IO89_19660 [Epilithonimonas lactis]SEP88822.1 hypothetical protein SAMN04488097_0986 [Epilithonimonas lactis]
MKKTLSKFIKDKFQFVWLVSVYANLRNCILEIIRKSEAVPVNRNNKLSSLISTLALVLVTSGILSAQTPTLIGQFTYTTKGAGAAGVPAFSYNIPAGKNRVMYVNAYFERDHVTPGSNYPGANADATPQLNIGTAINTQTSRYNYFAATNNAPTTAHFSTSLFVYRILNQDLPTGLTNFSFPTIAGKPPLSAGDDVVISVAIFENASQQPSLPSGNVTDFPSASTTFTSLTAAAPTGTAIPVGTTQANVVYYTIGAVSQDVALNNTAGWTDVHSINSTNNLGRNLVGLEQTTTYMPNNEADGIALKSIYLTGVTGNPSVTFSRSSSTKILTFYGRMNVLLPLARPSVSGTVYRDNNGGTIDGGGTGGGVWNTANTLYVNAVDVNGNVIATSLVSNTGIFSFPSGGNLIENDVVRFQLSRNQGVVGQPAPVKELPDGWGTVGESTASGTSDGTPNGEFTLTIGTANSASNTVNRFGVTACTAGNTGPSVFTSLENACSQPTVNLNNAHTGTVPTNALLLWFTTSNRAAGTQVTGTGITAAGAGTYYAFYYSTAANCYTPASAPVIARIDTLDSDNDGVYNKCDFDDDNDGILDSAECGGGAIYNYTGFGLRSASTGTDLYGFTGTNYAPVLISASILGTVGANHLATDASRNRILFTPGGTQGAISAYQFSTNTVVTVSTSNFLSTLDASGGGGSMYNGDYYIYDDDGTNQGLFRVIFDATGNASSLSKVANPVAGFDLGDMAISRSGIVYINSGGQIYRLDLAALNLSVTAPASAWSLLGTASPAASSQLFFGANGDLIGSNSGNLIRINTHTGANEGALTTNLSAYTWLDISEAPTLSFNCGTDTDVDGIPNSLDLDSDGDGCPDAREGAGDFNPTTSASGPIATQTPNTNFGTAVDITTGIPTAVGAGQGVGQSQDLSRNDCLDSDGDTIPDWQDLDDDNDGIPDTLECNSIEKITSGTFDGFGTNVVLSSVPGWSLSSGTVTSQNNNAIVFNLENTTQTLSQNLTNIKYPNTSPVFNIRVQNRDNLFLNNTGINVLIQYAGVTYATLTSISGASGPGTIVASNGATVNTNVLNSFNNGSAIGPYTDLALALPYSVPASGTFALVYSSPNSNGNADDIFFENISLQICGDTDGDGIPNNLDLDSDGDGCPDAREGAGDFNPTTSASGPIATQTPNTNFGTAIDITTGIPTAVATGQAIGQSQDASRNDCLDSDGDTIPDWQDLDDDNDGILDCVENGLGAGATASTVFELNGTANAISSNEIQLTAAIGSEAGQMWSYGKIDFSKSFTLNYEANLGNNNATGADGIAAVFHNSPLGVNALGSTGVGMGARGIANGIVLEIDTFENAGEGVGDIANDHGQIWVSSNQAGAGLLTAAADLGELEDGTWKAVVINWNFQTKTLSYTVGGINAGTYTFPASTPITSYFGGASKVYFGYTASTGLYFNDQRIRFANICSLPIDLDNDGDGIPNRLDLDSDGDGCTDAIEGGNTIAASSLVTVTVGPLATQTPNQNLGNTVGNTATTLGVPTIVATGQTIGNSQDVSKNDCLDSDGDGIPDWQDVDDDNDGILDTEECSNAVSIMYTKLQSYYSDGTGGAKGIVPSDFGLALGVKNQTVTRDLSAKFGYPANSGALVITLQNASVHPLTNSFWTKDGEAPTIWTVSGKLSSFVLMAQNPQFYGQDTKTIHIYDGSTVIPFALPSLENEVNSAEWSVSETATVKTLRSLRAEQSTSTVPGDWRFINMNFGDKRFGFSTTTRFADPTYEVVLYLECDSDMDGIPNRLDLDSDADGCSDALEGGANILANQLLTAGGTVNGGSTSVNQNICTTCISTSGANIGLPQFATLPTGYSNTTGQAVGDSQNGAITACYCTQPPAAGTGEITRVGISVQQKQTNWPENIPNGHIVLESKEKGLVITRVAHVSFVPQATDSIASPFAGMLVYDIQDACVKLFNGINWKCLERSCNTASN